MRFNRLIFLLMTFTILLMFISGNRFGESDFSITTIFGEFIYPHLFSNILQNELDSNLYELYCDIINLVPFDLFKEVCINQGLITNKNIVESYAPIGGMFFLPQLFYYFGLTGYLLLFILFVFYGFTVRLAKYNSPLFISLFISFTLILNRMGIIFILKIFLIIYINSLLLMMISNFTYKKIKCVIN